MIRWCRLRPLIFFFLLIFSAVSARDNLTHIHYVTENRTFEKIKLADNFTKIYDFPADSTVLHAEINEFDANLTQVPISNQSCKLTGSSFRLKSLSNLTLPSNIVSSPYTKDDRFFLITDKQQLLYLELREKEARIVSQLNLPKAEINFSTAIISEGEDSHSLTILTGDLRLLFVNITLHGNMSLLTERTIQLPEQKAHIHGFLYYKKHVILAQGHLGIRVYNADNATAPTLVKTLTHIDFKTLSEINITQVWRRNGVMFVADTPGKEHKTHMFNVSSINQGADIRRLRGEAKIDGVHIERPTFSTRPNFHIGFGSDIIVEFEDNTHYPQHSPWLKVKPARVHVLANGSSTGVFGVSNQTIVALTEKEMCFFKTSSLAPRSDIPYNLLETCRDTKGFEATTFIVLSNRYPSIIGFGLKNAINVYSVEFERPWIQCKALPAGSFRAIGLQLLSVNCSEAKSHQDVCISTRNCLNGSDLNILPQTYNFPNVSLPVLQPTHPFISSMLSSKKNQTEFFEEVDAAEKEDKSESNPDGKNAGNIAYLLIFTVILFVLYTFCVLLVRKSRSHKKTKSSTGEGFEFQPREKKGFAHLKTVDIEDDESSKIDTETTQ